MCHEMILNLLSLLDVSKTEYALALNYSPSTVSKFLSGEPISNPSIARSIAESSALFFTEQILEKHLESKLHEVFPLFLSLSSSKDLHLFFLMAMEYAICRCNGAFTSLYFYHNRRLSFYNEQETFFFLCVFISDLILQSEKDVAIYVTMPLARLLFSPWMKSLTYRPKRAR